MLLSMMYCVLVCMVEIRSMGDVDVLKVFVLLVLSVTIDAEEAKRACELERSSSSSRSGCHTKG